MAEEKKLTVETSLADLKRAHRAKRKLVERQREDFLFRLGKQWDESKEERLRKAGIEPIVDNRIQPNIHLITGLERQNRSDFKAFPVGEEDSLKAEIASSLFKDAVKVSDFGFIASEAFEDGITCGESAIELYLDYTENFLNGKPCWAKADYSMVFPDPSAKKYDYSDGRFIYKIKDGLSREDLCGIFPDKRDLIEKAKGGKLNWDVNDGENHRQPKDYPKRGGESGDSSEGEEDESFDLIERYWKKYVEKTFIGDMKTGKIVEAESKEKALQFVQEYRDGIAREQESYAQAQAQFQLAQVEAQSGLVPLPQEPIAPEQRDPERFILIPRMVPEIWYFAHVPGMNEPLADEVAWFYPKWKSFPIIPYFAHKSTAPITGDDRHLLVQGIVHGVKGVQKKHNSAETLKVIHLNASTNSGWLTEEGSWVDPKKVEQHAAGIAVNLEFKKDVKIPPQRIHPMELSQGHTQISAEAAEAIKQILGINSDLLAAQDGGSASGRAIALRQKQGLVMIQKLFDNLSRTKQLCGKFLLSQLGEIYDTETAKKVLGEAFLQKNFPPPMMMDESGAVDPATGMPAQVPMKDPQTGEPMTYDIQLAEVAIAEVLAGDLGQYDVTVGEAVASDTMKLANAAELQELAAKMPGIIPPDVLIEESQLNTTTKNRILGALKQAQAAAAAAVRPVPAGPAA